MDQVSQFIGIKFDWRHTEDNNLDIYLSQESFAEQLIASTGLSDATPVCTPFRYIHPIENITSTSALPFLT